MTINEIVNEVDKLVTKPEIRSIFIKHVYKFFKMVKDYVQAQQLYSNELEKAKKRIDKFTPKQLEKYKLQDGTIEISLVKICPPPKGYIKMNYWDNEYVNVPLGTIYRPKEPVNPILWFETTGDARLQRKPSQSERLMCDYVRLVALHDCILRFTGTLSDSIIINKYNNSKLFDWQRFCAHVHHCAEDNVSKFERTFERIKLSLKNNGVTEAEVNRNSQKQGLVLCKY